MNRTGIILMNTGTPDQPTPQAVKSYLNEFLSDPRIVHLPRWIWLPLLRYVILPIRAPKSAALYQQVWKADSPLRLSMNTLAENLEQHLNQHAKAESHYVVRCAMNYGNPRLESVLEEMKAYSIKHLTFLPLFPQASFTSTGSSLDLAHKILEKFSFAFPKIEWILGYESHPEYISSIAENIKKHWKNHGKSKRLLFSFHGIPTRFVQCGDPYPRFCEKTASLLAKALELNQDEWQLCYQSQFGYDEWLKPSTQALFQSLPKDGCDSIDICCPGFSVDCLETLEEIKTQGQHDFLKAGGKVFHYIPALNDESIHINLISQLCTDQPT